MTLPGGADQWPTDVRSNGGPALVTRLDDRPRLRLEPGRYSLNGAFAWNEMPDAISLPRQHGILRLALEGAAVAQPLIDGERLWLGKAPGAVGEVPNDSLTARVYRRIDDGVPMMLTTFVDLSVAGSHRIVTLGARMPEGFEATAFDEQPSGATRRQRPAEGAGRAGRMAGAVDRPRARRADVVPRHAGNRELAEGRDLGIQRRSRIPRRERRRRHADRSEPDERALQGPARPTSSPLDSDLKLVEQFRGDPSPSPNDFSLARSIWLSFDGSSYTVRDTLDGKLALPTRLAASFVPGRMTVDDKPELITRLGDAKPGVELPSGTHRIVAVSEMPRRQFDTAVGWETDVGALSGELHLPPGWRLLWTHGVDRAPTAWLPSWTLWDIFLVVISVVLALRLLGPTAAAMVALTLVLVYQEAEAPTLVWIVLLLLLAVLRIGRGRFGQFARLSYFVVFAFTVIGVLSFAIDNFRMAIYPQLENVGYVDYMPEAPSPAQATAPFVKQARDSAGALEEIVVTANKVALTPRRQFEANTQVQTGPGVPTWRWRSETLIWDGPVTAAQPIDLVLSPPWLTRSLHVDRPGIAAVARRRVRRREPAAVHSAAELAEARDRARGGRTVRGRRRSCPPTRAPTFRVRTCWANSRND